MNEQLKTEHTNDTELKYAVFKNVIVHISEVTSGLNSGEYQCPKCHRFLIAKKGNVRIHHFAHYNYENCQGAQETALHQLAKEILLHEKRIFIPNIDNSEHYRVIQFEDINQEVRLFNLIIDVLGSYELSTLAIEIKVTHEVDSNKISVVKEKAIEMIEIDLSSYINANLSREELTKIVVETAPRYWINQPFIKTTTEENKMSNIVKVIGFMIGSGYKRQDNSPFEMNKLYTVRPIEKTNTPNFRVSIYGGYTASDYNGKIIQLDIDNNPELHKKLESFNFPCDAELTFGTKLKSNGTLGVGIVTDVKLI